MRAATVIMIVCLLAAIVPGCSNKKEGETAESLAAGNKIGDAIKDGNELKALPGPAAEESPTPTENPLSVPESLPDAKVSSTLPLIGGKAKSIDRKAEAATPMGMMGGMPGTAAGGMGMGGMGMLGMAGMGGMGMVGAGPPSATPPAVADAVVGRDPSTVKTSKQNVLPSGILTAGSFDDNLDPFVFSRYAKKMSQRQGLGDLPAKLQGQRLLIIVKDGAGKPVGNARVKLAAGVGTPVEIVTRSDGRAVFVLPFDQLPTDRPLVATVAPPFGGTAVTETINAGVTRWDITLPGTQARLPKNLDLAIVIDTTGSMGDELKYLIAEVRGISAAIAKHFPEVRQRFALVCYRDEGQGDAYVTRPFDFTESLDVFHKRLSAQDAAGGGDYPEAMHRGLEDSLPLHWNDDPDTARVLFLIADAPPHAQHMTRTVAAANALRKKGVALYPVACSGYDDACEFVMRSCALITGSRFLFLTDDSGIGNSHAEPSIPYYQVERLEKLMIRSIASELSGQPIQANPADILRTVGKKVN